MEAGNCKGCGKLMLKRQRQMYCLDCMAEQTEDVRRIKAYLAENPRATVVDVHYELGMPLSLIQDLLQDDRLQCR